MDIITLGSGERLIECSSRLSEIDSEYTDRVIILPIPTTKDNKTIKGTDVSLHEVCNYILPKTLVVGYGIPDEICSEIHTRGGVIYDSALDEGFLLDNAEITAEGVVGTLLCSGKYRLSDMKIGIIGYGRIGRALCRLLLFLGAEIKVFTGRKDVIRSLGEISVKAESYLDMELSGLDVLINTAPEYLIPATVTLPDTLWVIDLASGNYLAGIRGVTKMASIPEQMYPRSAGKLYAEYIKKHL